MAQVTVCHHRRQMCNFTLIFIWNLLHSAVVQSHSRYSQNCVNLKCEFLCYLFAATETGNDATLTCRLGGKSLDVTATYRPVTVNSAVTSCRQPDDVNTVTMSSRRQPGVKTSVTGDLSDKEIELQQQMYITRLLDCKSSSRRHAAV